LYGEVGEGLTPGVTPFRAVGPATEDYAAVGSMSRENQKTLTN